MESSSAQASGAEFTVEAVERVSPCTHFVFFIQCNVLIHTVQCSWHHYMNHILMYYRGLELKCSNLRPKRILNMLGLTIL